MLNKKFLRRVIREKTVDTRNYRYTIDKDGWIIRAPILTCGIIDDRDRETVAHVNNIH